MQWYSISVTSVRRVAGLLVLAAALVAGSLLLQRWEHRSLRDRSEAVISEATDLARRLEGRVDFEQARIEHFVAWQDLEAAHADFAAEHYGSALDRAERSLRVLRQVFNAESSEGGELRFTNVQGGVEYRRGEHGAWRRARSNDVLSYGDWVRTSADGTAEIHFSDGAVYVVRTNTLVRLDERRNALTGNEERVTDIQFGWVDISNTRSASKVTTPKSEAKVRQDSEAEIVFDPDQGTGHISTFRGSAEIASANGQTRELGARQQVEQIGDLLTAPKQLPGKPQPLRPTDNQTVTLESAEVQLAWRPVRGSARYVLNVSRSPLFASNLIAADDRRKTSARLGLRGEGLFYWQVAAIDPDGARGAWSDTRSFRVVTAPPQADGTADTIPPELEIADMQAFGSLVIVNGRTEPGATVEINGEPVLVQIDGAFNKTIQLSQVGFAFIRVVATDAWDNPTEIKRRVFIDSF
ncbi:MAG: hypothetical protein V3T72_08110 [Thermoanaerobaculia bacterium]